LRVRSRFQSISEFFKSIALFFSAGGRALTAAPQHRFFFAYKSVISLGRFSFFYLLYQEE
jgi:hypothetical protein